MVDIFHTHYGNDETKCVANNSISHPGGVLLLAKPPPCSLLPLSTLLLPSPPLLLDTSFPPSSSAPNLVLKKKIYTLCFEHVYESKFRAEKRALRDYIYCKAKRNCFLVFLCLKSSIFFLSHMIECWSYFNSLYCLIVLIVYHHSPLS